LPALRHSIARIAVGPMARMRRAWCAVRGARTALADARGGCAESAELLSAARMKCALHRKYFDLWNFVDRDEIRRHPRFFAREPPRSRATRRARPRGCNPAARAGVIRSEMPLNICYSLPLR